MLAQISMSAPLGRHNLIHHSPYLLDSTVKIEPNLILSDLALLNKCSDLEERGGRGGLRDIQNFPIIWSQVIYGRYQQQTGHQNLTETANML